VLSEWSGWAGLDTGSDYLSTVGFGVARTQHLVVRVPCRTERGIYLLVSIHAATRSKFS
jgi:hypothetical protein